MSCLSPSFYRPSSSLSLPGLYSLWEVLYLQRGSAELPSQPGRGHGQRPGDHAGHPAGGVPAHLERDKYASRKGAGLPWGLQLGPSAWLGFPNVSISTVQMRHHLRLASECRSTAKRSHPTSISWALACPQASRPSWPARNSG